ncbi:MAG: hypothetical protein ABL930_02770, partial [Pseudobdellovibrio sp.]
MQLAYSPYSLQKKSKLNAKDVGSEQKGALIKVTDEGAWGVADICPKPELGDLSLEQQIISKDVLFLRAMELAIEDMLARKNQKSLLQNKFVKNNYLITDYSSEELNKVDYFNNTIKIKADADTMSLALKLNNLHEDIRVRLDFNSSLNAQQFELFLSFLSEKAITAIEYIEDPTPINEQWKIWNSKVALAFDFQPTKYNSEFAHYHIIKPSRERLSHDLQNVVLTSAMDHPVGVAHGLRLAQSYANKDSGFLTLNVFEDIGFNQYFEQKNN